MLRGDATLSDALVAKPKATKSHATNTTILILIIPHAGFVRCMQGCVGNTITRTVLILPIRVVTILTQPSHTPEETLVWGNFVCQLFYFYVYNLVLSVWILFINTR